MIDKPLLEAVTKKKKDGSCLRQSRLTWRLGWRRKQKEENAQIEIRKSAPVCDHV